MKKPVSIALGIMLLVLVIGVIIPKVIVKNPDLSSSSCAKQNVKAVSSFPLSLVRTVKVEKFTLTSVDMSFYTLFGIKLKYHTGVTCLLGSNHTWTKYENSKLGFSLEYPSDLLEPQEGGQDEPGTVSFVKNPEAEEKILVDVSQTNFADIWSYMAKNPMGENSATTTVGDFPAIVTKDSSGPCSDCVNYLFFAQGNRYILSVNLPAPDTARVVNSFRVTALSASANLPAPFQPQEDSFDGQTYINSQWGFSFAWNRQLYLSNMDYIENVLQETPGAEAANGTATLDAASGVVNMLVNKFASLYKTQDDFCNEEMRLNPGITKQQCMPVINRAQLLQMKKDLAAKRLTANVVLRGDKKDTVPQFIGVKGGVGVLSTLYDFNGNWWNVHFTTLTSSNDLVDIYLSKPNPKTVQELTTSPEYKAFVEVMTTFEIWNTYTNTSYGYSLKYPQGFQVRNTGPSSLALAKSNSVYISGPSQSGGVLTIEMRNPALLQGQNVTNMQQVWSLPLKDYAYRIWQDNKDDKNPNIKNKQLSDIKELTLDGQPAYSFTLTGSYYGEDIEGGSVLEEPYTYVITGKGRDKYQISFPSGNNTLNSILSTFKYAQ